MKLDIIEKLKRASPKKRIDIVQAMNAKNIAYFKRRLPELGEALAKLGTGNFEIRFDEAFLNVMDRATGQYCHPPGKLLEYMDTVSSWHHSGWIDKLSVLHVFTGVHEHGLLINEMLEGIYAELPQITQRMRSGVITLPRMKDGRRFSGSTVFLGVLTGLHIVKYLNSTAVRDVILIEPDAFKFALSCWFVDYEAIEARFGRLVMHVGNDIPENPLNYLVGASPITAGVWMRMLAIYPSDVFNDLINRVNLRWAAIHEIIVPFDREVRNLVFGAANLRAKRPMLSRRPALSAASRIAVVGSGPSLDNDMEWLRENQDKLIIFSAHSTVRALRKNGITPDFQCTLDTELDDDIFAKLALDPDIPLLCYYKMDPKILERFKTVLLVPESGKANPVQFPVPVTYTHPTSGNMAVAAALFMHPREIYMMGIDLGFRQAKRSHVSGAWHDDDEGAGHRDAEIRDNIRAIANFTESDGEIFTHAYYDHSRFSMEAAIAALGAEMKVHNLSDGVRIAGAEPRRSSDTPLDSYPEKAADVAAIHGAFSSEGGWTPYPTSGVAMLQAMKESLLDTMGGKEVRTWPDFALALDTAWGRFVQSYVQAHPEDLRFEAYSRLIVDLLANWYRIMVFTDAEAEFATGHAAGVAMLAKVLDKLAWPVDLDFDPGPA